MNTDVASRILPLAGVLRWAGAIGILAIATMRALTAFAPQVYFDFDPAIDPSALAALGPAGSLWLDVLLLLACALAFLGESLAGRTFEWKLFLLAAIPAPVIFYHGWYDLGDLWRGTTWLAAAFAAVAAAHLARDRIMRLVLLCTLTAIVGPLLVRGISQVTIEHAATVAQFEQTKDEFLRDRGWEPGSPSAQIYERRLRQAQPTGWFATTNIYGSVMAAAFIVFCGLTLAAIRAGSLRRWSLAPAILAFLTLIALFLTGSKGALLATIIGGVVLTLLQTQYLGPHLPRLAPLVLIALIPLTLLGVIIRGALLPEDFLGDRSLLFRWHYLVSSVDIFRSAPLLGVGPDGYQLAYTMFRLPRNPEEVASAHSVFVDWLCTLGVLGFAWVSLVLAMFWRAGRSIPTGREAESNSSSDVARTIRTAAAGVVILGAFPAIFVEQHVLGGEHFILRVLGIVAFLAIAAVAALIVQRAERVLMDTAMAVAAAVLLMHGQVEMTFYQPGAIVWAMCLIGVAGTQRPSAQASSHPKDGAVGHSPVNRTASVVAVVLLSLLALWIAAAAWPATVQSARMAEAARVLYPPAESAPQRVEQRRIASAMLLEAYERSPTNVLPLHASIRQLDVAANEAASAAQRDELLGTALVLANRAVDSHRQSTSLGLRAGVRIRLAYATSEVTHLHAAIDDLAAITRIDPHGIQPWQRLGDAYWLAGLRRKAAVAYERAIVNDANFELDPLKRLPEAQRQLLRERIRLARDEQAQDECEETVR